MAHKYDLLDLKNKEVLSTLKADSPSAAAKRVVSSAYRELKLTPLPYDFDAKAFLEEGKYDPNIIDAVLQNQKTGKISAYRGAVQELDPKTLNTFQRAHSMQNQVVIVKLEAQFNK